MSNVKLAALFARKGYDAIVALSPVNVLYLSGANIHTQRSIPDRLALVLWPADSDPSLLVCTIEESQARRQSRIKDVRSYFEFKESPIQLLANTIKEKRLDRGRIGIEKRYITAEYFDELVRSLPDVTFDSCDRDLDLLRAVKSAGEIELLKNAAICTDKAIATAYEGASEGRDEKYVADAMRSALFQNGAEELAFLHLGAGEHSIEAHHTVCDKKLKKGDIMRVDIGGSFGGYYSDLARTAVVGEASANQAKAYKALWDVMEEVIGAIVPGAPAKTLYNIYKTRFEEQGFAVRMSHVGHSLGIKLHEQPMLTPYEEHILEPNMVLEIELVHIEDGSRYHNEDQVIVMPGGHEVVSRTRDWNRLFEIH
jgi:Xaa-Pro aminopeptidase